MTAPALAQLREALGDDKAPDLAGYGPPFDKLLARLWIVEQAARTLLEGEKRWHCVRWGHDLYTQLHECDKHKAYGCHWRIIIPIREGDE